MTSQWNYLVTCHKEMVAVTSNVVSERRSSSGDLIWKSLRDLSQCNRHGDSQWSLQMTVTRESPNHFIVTSTSDSSQSNNHGGFTVQLPSNGHLRVVMRRIKCIAFRFPLLTVTAVSICDATVASHRMAMLLG